MTLVTDYARQHAWRRWPEVYPALGDLAETRVLDLGCGIGDQARDLAARGAEVWGVDANPALIDHARSRGIPRARFRCADLEALDASEGTVSGVWASFVAAYFPRFDELLAPVEPMLEPGGWLAITEVDDLFGHEPLDARWRDLVEAYYARSLEEGVHRFRSRAHVCSALARGGWRVEVTRELDDDEFGFTGPASAEVLDGWRARLARMMPHFVERFGDRAVGFDDALLACLSSAEHRSRSQVWFVLARRDGDAAPVRTPRS